MTTRKEKQWLLMRGKTILVFRERMALTLHACNVSSLLPNANVPSQKIMFLFSLVSVTILVPKLLNLWVLPYDIQLYTKVHGRLASISSLVPKSCRLL